MFKATAAAVLAALALAAASLAATVTATFTPAAGSNPSVMLHFTNGKARLIVDDAAPSTAYEATCNYQNQDGRGYTAGLNGPYSDADGLVAFTFRVGSGAGAITEAGTFTCWLRDEGTFASAKPVSLGDGSVALVTGTVTVN